MEASDATKWFYGVVWPQRDVVLRAAIIQTGNVPDAEDLTQETLLKAFRSRDTYRDQSSIKAWLLTIMRNARIDRLRTAAGSAKNVSLDDLPVEMAAPDAPSEHMEASWQNPEGVLNEFSDAAVIDALKNIAEELRWTLLLVDVEGLDQNDAASILDVPVGTVKSRLHRGRAMLRQSLLHVARDMRLVRD